MKTTILYIFALMFFVSCNGGGSGGGSSDPVLDARLTEGNGKWTASYTINTDSYTDDLEFTGDEVTRDITIFNGGGTGGPYTTVYKLTPVTNTSFHVQDITNNQDKGIYTYSISGSVFQMCDGNDDCIDFNKVP